MKLTLYPSEILSAFCIQPNYFYQTLCTLSTLVVKEQCNRKVHQASLLTLTATTMPMMVQHFFFSWAFAKCKMNGFS